MSVTIKVTKDAASSRVFLRRGGLNMSRRKGVSMKYPDTTPSHKYGPTPVYGPCEVEACEATARTTCGNCTGDYCLKHAGHDAHRHTHANA
jgi:predicted nucleic acid binding AN1-type Zn finger protein